MDYKLLVDFAKENKIPFITPIFPEDALVSKKGLKL
jgi:hypothetical protein